MKMLLNSIKLHADTGSSQTIQILNDEGTTDGTDGAGAIDIEATNGGIGLRWNNSKTFMGRRWSNYYNS